MYCRTNYIAETLIRITVIMVAYRHAMANLLFVPPQKHDEVFQHFKTDLKLVG